MLLIISHLCLIACGRWSMLFSLYGWLSAFYLSGALQCGVEVGDEVVDVFYADAEAEHVRVDSCCNLLFRA